MASDYDDAIWELVGTDPQPPPARLVEFVAALGPVDRALDLGCGDGRLSISLRADRLTLADPSPVALARALERVPTARAVELEPDRPLPLEDNAFDLALCCDVLEHVRDTRLLLSEARRVLVPGGQLVVTTPAHGRRTGLSVLLEGFEARFDPRSPHLRFFTQRSLGELLDALGFDVEALETRARTLYARARR